MNAKYQRALDLLNSFKTRYGEKIVKIIAIANHYIFMNLTDAMVAGLPQPAILDGKKIWSIPILLSSRVGISTEIGVIFIEDETQEIIGATENSVVMQNAESLGRDYGTSS